MKSQKLIFFLLILLGISFLSAQERMPAVYVIGDSISIQYGPYLEQQLKGFFNYGRKQDDGQAAKNLDVPTGANGGDSRMVLEFLKTKKSDPAFKPDLLLLNCGLHDIKRDPQTEAIQVEAGQYRQNLEAIYQIVREKNIRLVWVRTTPVVDEQHNARSKTFHRFAKDVAAYNVIADEVFAPKKVPIIDLHGFTANLGADHYIDHVHYDETTRALQAAFIAGSLVALKKNGML